MIAMDNYQKETTANSGYSSSKSNVVGLGSGIIRRGSDCGYGAGSSYHSGRGDGHGYGAGDGHGYYSICDGYGDINSNKGHILPFMPIELAMEGCHG